MKKKQAQSIIVGSLACLTFSLVMGCGGSSKSTTTPPPPTIAISATAGTPQSATVGTAFATTLQATVTSNGSPASGVTVTFMAPGSGASGTFGNSTATEQDTTNSSGVATSSTFTANTKAGGYIINAAATGAATNATFALVNNAGPAATLGVGSGSGQNASTGAAFAAPLVVNVTDSDGNAVQGASVTFTAPGSGASGTFHSTGTNTETDTSDSNGHATSSTFTANSVGGIYNVAATSGSLTAVNFALTNNAVVPASNTYAFYLSGMEAINSGPNFYALAGSVTINTSGTVTRGEQDYNDGFGITSPQPNGDSITGGTLSVDPTTGQGTLTLVTNNISLGISGTETLGVQFVNASHALVVQFDGTATSSGSFDLQTLPGTVGGGYAFTFSGVDASYAPVAYGGVFTINGTNLQNGLADVNDAGATVQVTTQNTFSGSLSAADSFGRGQVSGITINGVSISIVYYVIGPEVIRIIDVDALDSAIGTAFGQGTNATAASNASLGSSVFTIAGNPFSLNFGTIGEFSTNNTSQPASTFSGVGEDNEVGAGIASDLAASISGTYVIGASGYGSLTVVSLNLGDVESLGIYMTDPNLNLNDPNNTSTGLGGGLILDLDDSLPGGTGVITPQTDPSTASFAGNYAVGWQDVNIFGTCSLCEFDMVAQGSMTAGGALSLTGLVSDPFSTLGTPDVTSSGDTFSGAPLADTTNPGRYSMLSSNTTPNPLNATIDGGTGFFDLVLYQASGGQLFWLEYDDASVFVGPLEQQGSLTGLPTARTPVKKLQGRQKR